MEAPDIICIKCKRGTKNIDARKDSIIFHKYDPEDKHLTKSKRRIVGSRNRDAIKATCGECGCKKSLLSVPVYVSIRY